METRCRVKPGGLEKPGCLGEERLNTLLGQGKTVAEDRPTIDPLGDQGHQDPTRAVSDWAERESPGPGSMQGGPNGESVKGKRSR